MTTTSVGSPRPTDAELVAMLRKAAELIVTLSHKDIRKSFHEQNFAANTLGKAANALEAAGAEPLAVCLECGGDGRPGEPRCQPCERLRAALLAVTGSEVLPEFRKWAGMAELDDVTMAQIDRAVSGVDYTFTEGC